MRTWVTGESSSETPQQCHVRDANERAKQADESLPDGLRCECGDPACEARVSMSRAAYERVRARGSRFLIEINHENPESACVICELPGYAVIDVIEPHARFTVLARNARRTFPEDAPAGTRRPTLHARSEE